jgi:hypothetical protein
VNRSDAVSVRLQPRKSHPDRDVRYLKYQLNDGHILLDDQILKHQQSQTTELGPG